MPFGVLDAPVVFQELMSVVLQGFHNFVMTYLDDILVFSSTLKNTCEYHLNITFYKW